MPNERLHSLDVLRGIMMLLGVVLHAAASFVVYPIEELWPYKFSITNVYFDATLTIIHLFRIPVFYIIAGYFMSMVLEKYDLKTVIKKRIKRIVIPFLLGMLFLAPLVTFGFYLLITETNVVSWQTIKDYQSVSYVSTVHFWFLYYLIFFYGVHLLYWRFLRQHVRVIKIAIKPFFLLAFGLQILLLIVAGNDSIHGNYSLLPPVGSILYFMSYYFIGLYVYKHLDTFLEWTKVSIKNIVLAVVSITIYLVFRDNEDQFGTAAYWSVVESVLTVLASASLVVAVFGIFVALFAKPKPWIDFIAKSSYTVYMVHLPIIIWLIYFLKDIIENPFLFYALLIGLTSLIAFAVYFIRKKVFRV